MESINQTSRFSYHFGESEGNIDEHSGTLEIFAHHARSIHNICIYDNQDVYAKFSLTYNPDDMVSTQIIMGGGKNPEFNENLALNVTQVDSSVLKCEIWMHSRAKNLMEDQLLGFTLVPISEIVTRGGKIVCQDFSLSSTDLFHSPAGIVQLSLTLITNNSTFLMFSPGNNNPSNSSGRNSSITSEVVLLDPNDYSRVQFPDVNADTQDQMIISGYSNHSLGSFLHLGSLLKIGEDTDNDDEMIGNSVFSSTTTSVSEDRNSADLGPIEKISGSELGERQSNVCDDETDGGHEGVREIVNTGMDCGNVGRVNSGTEFEAEQATMQQQIVDMYMKSMQQFTESLAKMKLPMELNPNPSPSPNPDSENSGNVIQIMKRGSDLEVENKKDGTRVFYGSRAFF